MKPYKTKNKKLKFVTEEKKKGNKSRAIIAIFVCFILLFATVSIIYFLKSYDYDLSKVLAGEKTTEKGEEGESHKTTAKLKGKATFMLAGCSTNKDELYFVSLIRVDVKEMKTDVCCIPTDAIVNGGTIEQSFVSGGAGNLAQATSKYAQTKIDRYVVVDEKNFKKAISYLGNYSLTLQERIAYNGGEYALNLVKGKQTLTGDKLMHYIRYQEIQGGAYLNSQARIIGDMMDQMINEINYDKGEELFNKLINIVDSDISIVDYTKYQEYLKAYVESAEREPSVNAELSEFKD